MELMRSCVIVLTATISAYGYINSTFSKQVNAITTFIDASMVYGSSEEELEELRGENGDMKVGIKADFGGKPLLPFGDGASEAECLQNPNGGRDVSFTFFLVFRF